MFSFLDYVFEIWTVSAVRGVDVGVAYDMFRTDVRVGRALPYNTGAALPDFDFAAAREEWDALTEDEQLNAYDEWHEFIADCHSDVCVAFAESEDTVAALVSEWRDSHENN